MPFSDGDMNFNWRFNIRPLYTSFKAGFRYLPCLSSLGISPTARLTVFAQTTQARFSASRIYELHYSVLDCFEGGRKNPGKQD
jgi:hypothetical protein